MILSRRSKNCPSTQVYHNESYVVEVYAWTILGIVAFIARYTVRLRILPWRRLQGDDWMGIAVLLFFIGLTSVKLTVYHLGTNSDYAEDALRKMLQCQVDRIEFGSKLQVSAWYFYACFLWGLKAMVLFLLSRLSLPPFQRSLLKTFTIFSILTFVAVILTISCGCRPFNMNWGTLPYPPARCTSRTQNFYTAAILNIITDSCILSIALPLLWSLRVPLSRKIALTCLLCSGIFIISAAIVAMLMSLLDAHSTLNTNRWATREEIAGILAVNAPTIKPMFYKTFWRRDFNPQRNARPRRAGRPHAVARPPPVIDPEVVVDVPPPAMARRLGVLSSIRSDYFARAHNKHGSSSGTGESGASGPEDSYKPGTKVEEVETVWGMNSQDGTMVAYPPFVAREGPEPLLPEPTHSWSSRGNSLPWPELQAIDEEENGEKFVKK